MIKIKKGLSLPLEGAPSATIAAAESPELLAITGLDYPGMKPSLLVRVGDAVKIGQPLFTCKKSPGLTFTAPAGGKVTAINRGDKRVFQNLVIKRDSKEARVTFKSYQAKGTNVSLDGIRALLVESGLWTCIRERPFDKTPAIDAKQPKDIFVSIADTNPLAADPTIIIAKHPEHFAAGLEILSKLCERQLFVCRMDFQKASLPKLKNLKEEVFQGPHPAGTVGTQMHYLSPPTLKTKVWYVGYQDVIAMGHLFQTGQLWLDRYVAIGGPGVKNPRILKTRIGADLRAVTKHELKKDLPYRVISGSVLHGRPMADPFCFLGAFHNQISVLHEDRERELLGWHMPGFDKFSVKRVFAAKLFPIPVAKPKITTSTHGSKRAMVAFGHFEKVCAFDTLPTQLLRALLVGDTDAAQDLGVLELGEEDMAPFTFVSTGKTDFGPLLRSTLDIIEKEG